MSDDLRKRIIRERETEQRIRAMDTHEIVELIHALEDEREELLAEVERLRQANAAYNDEHEMWV